jgi:flagellin-like hook-associated protein FlgL
MAATFAHGLVEGMVPPSGGPIKKICHIVDIRVARKRWATESAHLESSKEVVSSISLNSNVASLDAQRRLGESTASLSRSFEQLSSGLRINKPSDDAAGLSVASSLDADARVFNQGVRNVNDGISYLNIAEGATSSLKDILIRMRELATQSSNGTLSDTQRKPLDSENQALIGEYNRILETTDFNGRQLFDPENQEVTVQAGYGESGSITISLGTTTEVTKGDGTFQAPQSFATGAAPNSVTVGDFNGDGKADLVTADASDNTVSVLLGNGDGTFQASQPFATAGMPESVAIGDFNGDGNADLVTADGFGKTSVLLGNGDGTFQAQHSYAVGTSLHSVAIGDFNGDGNSDLVTADYLGNTASVLLGNGDGTFQASQSFATGSGPISVAIGDFNGDGVADLVSADSDGNTASVLLGNGDGTFQASQSFPTAGFPDSVAIGDFNGDGNSDLVTADGSGKASVLLGNGDGTFQASQSFPTGGFPDSVAIGDFNGDGKTDLVTADEGGNTASVLLGNGDGTFQPKQSFATGLAPYSVAISDFNGDGTSDIVTADEGGNTASVLLGNGITTGQTISIRSLSGISVATLADARDAQGAIDSELQTVNLVAGIIGSGISRLQTAADNLRVGSEGFSEARSRIVDADVAEESANLVQARILQQAGAAVLSQANKAPALALVLLRAG